MDAILHADLALSSWVVAHRVGGLNWAMWTLSAIGRGGTVFLVIGVGLAIARRVPARGLARLLLAIVLATLVADHLLKPMVHRQRPFRQQPAIEVIGGRPDDASFPSGHAANAFAGASVLGRLLPSAAWIWWSVAAGVAVSRVYLGVHYPLDVLAGAAVGLGCAALASIRWTEDQ
jgi:undecaprenyl-diphosphatase